MTTQRARLRELLAETTQGEWSVSDHLQDEYEMRGIEIANTFVTVAFAALEPQRDKDAEFIVAAHNALPALLDELDAMERERDRLRAENEQLRSKFDDLLKTVKPYADKCERQDRLIIALVAGRNIDQLLDEKLGDKPSAD